MKQRITAMLLAAVLVLSLGAVSLAAEEQLTGAGDAASEPVETPVSEETAESAETVEAEETPQIPVDDVTGEVLEEATEGMLFFTDIEERVKKNNLTYKSMQASASAMNDMRDMADDLKAAVRELKSAIENLDPDDEDYEDDRAYLEGKLAETEAAYKSISASVQETTQLDSGRKQLIYGAETVFITLVGLEQQEAALERQMKALDRTVQEMELRHQMGQVSKLQLMEVQNGRTSLVSGLTSLRMNITILKLQLEQMVGAELTGATPLGALPQVTEEELNALDFDKGLKLFMRKSMDIQIAGDQLDQAGGNSALGDAGESMEDAADYAYEAAKEQAEMKFRILWAKLQDCRQVLAAAESALEVETLACQAAELKYQQGTISRNALLTTEDEMKAAQDSLMTARNNLFSTYNNYCWAVNDGILS